MLACVFTAPARPLELTEVPDPRPGPGEVVVRVSHCGVCSSDLHAANSGTGLRPGTVMGHEISGTITEVGPAVEALCIGDRVAVTSYLACGACAQCLSNHEIRCERLKMVGFDDVPGGFAELVKIRASSVFKLPPTLDLGLAATLEPLVVGLHGINRAAIAPGESCLVMGAGPIGLVTIAWARLSGARRIVLSEVSPFRRAAALKMGADVAVDPRITNPAATLRKDAPDGPDVVFDCVGAAGSLAEAITYARKGGRVVSMGASMGDDGINPGIAMAKELDIRFSLGLEPESVGTAIATLATGRLSTAPMITHVVGLKEFPRAFAALPRAVDQIKVMMATG
jgi:(R,R)-butanediol dehydrogenase/meso-butanediol dehydrogenase/diacetyl reductase